MMDSERGTPRHQMELSAANAHSSTFPNGTNLRSRLCRRGSWKTISRSGVAGKNNCFLNGTQKMTFSSRRGAPYSRLQWNARNCKLERSGNRGRTFLPFADESSAPINLCLRISSPLTSRPRTRLKFNSTLEIQRRKLPRQRNTLRLWFSVCLMATSES